MIRFIQNKKILFHTRGLHQVFARVAPTFTDLVVVVHEAKAAVSFSKDTEVKTFVKDHNVIGLENSCVDEITALFSHTGG